MVVEKQKMVEQTLGLNLAELGDTKPGEKLSAGEVERLRSLLPEGLLPDGDLTQLEVKSANLLVHIFLNIDIKNFFSRICLSIHSARGYLHVFTKSSLDIFKACLLVVVVLKILEPKI